MLSDIDAQGIPEIVNLGDHFSGPLNAAQTANMLIDRNIPAIRGNHDRYLLTRDPAEMGPSDRVAYDELEKRHFDWLAELPETLVYRNALFLCHGTPASDETYWMEALTADGVVHMAGRKAIESLRGGDRLSRNPLRPYPYRTSRAACGRPPSRQSRERRLPRI